MGMKLTRQQRLSLDGSDSDENVEEELTHVFEPFSPSATRGNIPMSAPDDRLCRARLAVPSAAAVPGARTEEEEESHEKKEEEELPKYDKRFKYDTCATNLTHFPSLEYIQCEAPPYGARLNPVERGQNTAIVGAKEEVLEVADGRGYGSAKANVCMKGGGSWYFEIEVLRAPVRIGIGRREASCEGPVGCNAYSYGIEARAGRRVHCGRLSEFVGPLPAGTVVGFHVHLPLDSRPARVNRTRIPVKVGKQLWFESLNYRSTYDTLMWESEVSPPPPPAEELIAGSFCRVFVNGVDRGVLAEPLREFRPPCSQYSSLLKLPPNDDGMLGYYPMISVFESGAARLNCGPEFRHAPPAGAEGLCARYDEQVADDFLLDLMDEIVYEEVDKVIPHMQRRKLREFKAKEPKSNVFGLEEE